MEILVCIKQVPDVEDLKIDVDTSTIKGGFSTIVNPYDKNALEAAVQLKELHGGNVTVLTIGSSKAKYALKECVSVGADYGVLINDNKFVDLDSYSISKVLAAAIKKLGDFDLIICGNQAMDTNAGQVGSQLAELLNLAQITYVNRLEVKDSLITAKREVDEGTEVLEAKIPVVCTVVDSINEPRLATIKTKMAANKAKFQVFSADDLGIETVEIKPLMKLIKSSVPPKREAGIMIQGNSSECAHELLKNLVTAKLI